MTEEVGTYTVGDLARTAGINASAVRYYERLGLLKPNGRTAGNYRIYEEDALERLLFIRAAQANGFSLDDVRTLLDLRDGETDPCDEVQELLEHRLVDLNSRMKELQGVKRTLKGLLERCRASATTPECHVIDSLETKTKRRKSSRTKGTRKPRR